MELDARLVSDAVFDLYFRTTPHQDDTISIYDIVASTGKFMPYEVSVAVELVEDAIAKGAKSDYQFIFADGPHGAVGYTCFGRIPCTLSSFDLYWIAVHHDCQGRGLGRDLLHRTEIAAAAQGATKLYVETSGRPDYEPTRRFYLGNGYAPEAVFKDFYAPGDDKVVYGKTLRKS